MGLIDTVGSMLSGGAGPEIVYECRQCGETMDGLSDTCPSCGSDGIAQFEIE